MAQDDLLGGPLPHTKQIVDGDSRLAYVGEAQPDSEMEAYAAAGSGFNLFNQAYFRSGYTIRLRDTSNVESVRDELTSGAARFTQITGIPVTVAAGRVTYPEPRDGEILVEISATSECDPTGTDTENAGCGGPTYTYSNSQRIVSGGKIWLKPFTLTYTQDQLNHLVRHELGHAWNLRHYDAEYDGLRQLMHTRLYDATDFRSGDQNGLRAQIDKTCRQWCMSNALPSTSSEILHGYGLSSDRAVVGNWDGRSISGVPNSAMTIGMVRPQNGVWMWHLSNDNRNRSYDAFSFGLTASDRPIVGDWDGNGTHTPGIVREVNGQLEWHYTNGIPATTTHKFTFGKAGDIPVPGNWNTSTRAWESGIVRGTTWMLNSTLGGGSPAGFSYGEPGDIPVTGDWNRDGATDIGAVRDNVWNLRTSKSGGPANITFAYGSSSNSTWLPGDWDGDGDWTPGLRRNSSG